MGVFQRILKNLGAMFTARLLSIIQQVIIPPIFIHRYSTASFGEWGVLSGAVAALGMLNFGVQTYMNQDLAVRYNRGDFEDHQRRQSTALRLLGGIVVAAAILSLAIFAVPLDTLLKLDINRHAAQLTAYLLACQVLLNILYGYFTGIFMGVALAHRGSYWNNFQALLTALALLLCVSLRLPFPVLAGAQLLTMSISIVAVLIDIRRTAPALFPVIRYWEASAVKDILKPSGYFGLITICTFLTYQAPLIVLQRLLGPVAVAGFIVMRLVFSMCRQLLAMFTQSMGAEITNLFARNDWPGLARLYDYSERLVFFMIPIVNTGVLLLSPLLITVWMHKRAELFSPYPYVLSAAISMVISLKEHKYQFQFSTNTHEALARNMFFSYLAMVAISIGVIPIAGIVGFLWLWLAIESIQVVRIVRLNLELFAGHDAVEFHYMRRLVGICAPALLISLLILQRSASYPLLLQLGISVAAGLVIAGLSWRLFGMNTVLKKMSGTLSRKFA
jgi:O-antigen/teichoic acid export membrane protein